MFECEYDNNGYCIYCGYPQQRRLQVIKFINPVQLNNGECLSIPPPIFGADGRLAEGSYHAEIRKKREHEYEARIVGQG